MLKKTLIFSLSILSVFTLITCKKYPEGGWNNVANKHLSDGQYNLILFEVNGVDSTEAIKNNNNVGYRVGYTAIQFAKEHSRDDKYILDDNTAGNDYTAQLISSKTEISIYHGTESGIYCQNSGGGSIYKCYRRIFCPDGGKLYYNWKIIKLTKKDLIIEYDGKQHYKIVLKKK